jgi:outer membrane lipoprotein-sorting protein
MSRYLRLPWLYLVAVLITVCQGGATNAIASVGDATTASSILRDGKNGTALVDSLIGHVNSLGTYKFDGAQEALEGSKTVKASGTFYFKPTNSMRVEVKEYGSKSGSILVKGRDGKIEAKGGARLLGMKMTLTSDSRLLRLPNGTSAVESDLASLLKRLKKQASSGYKLVSTSEPVTVDGLSKRAIVLELQKDGTEAPVVVDRVFIDPAQKLPMQWDSFQGGKFQSRSKFQNYQINVQLDDSQFTI